MIELPTISSTETQKRKPNWLRVKLPVGPDYARVRRWVRTRLDTTIPKLGGVADSAENIVQPGIAPDALHANGAIAGPRRPLTPFVTDKRLLVRCDEAFSKVGAP